MKVKPRNYALRYISKESDGAPFSVLNNPPDDAIKRVPIRFRIQINLVTRRGQDAQRPSMRNER